MKIAIAGKMCSGKTTLCNHIIKEYPHHIKKSIAGKVKEIATEMFGMKEKDRKLLQTIGTQFREIDNDVWIKYLINQNLDNVIIDDLRYENEAKLLKEDGWYIIRLNINEKLQIERIKNTYTNWDQHIKNINHESELEIDKIDKYIDLDIESSYDSSRLILSIFNTLVKESSLND